MFNQKNNTYANFGVRLLALIMDIFMVTLPINVAVGLIFGFDALKNGNDTAGIVQLGLLVVVTLGFWYFDKGRTPGKRAFSIRVVDAKTLGEAPLWKLVIRYFSYFLSMISIIGFFLPFFRKDKRALHDLIAGTAVIFKNDITTKKYD